MDPRSTEADEARSRLGAARERIERLLHELEHDRDEDGPIDELGGDAGAGTTTAAANLGTQQGLRRQLEEVDAALQRVDDGSYGIDELTGEPINPARLEAEPTARTNV